MQSEILIFDKQGHYVTKIMKGRGPDEVLYPTDISIDPETGHIFVLDYYRTIKEFDLHGNRIASFSTDDPYFYLSRVDGGFLVCEPNMSNSTDKLLTFISDKKTKTGLLDKEFDGNFYAEPSMFTSKMNGIVFVNSIFSDTVYTFSSEDRNIHAAYFFDFEGRGANRPERLRGMADLGEYLTNARETGLYTGVSNFTHSDNTLFFSVDEGTNTYFCRYDTENNVFGYSDRLFEELPNSYIRVGTIVGYTIFVYSAQRLVDYFTEHEPATPNVREIGSGLSEYDNPVIVFAAM